MAIRLSGMASGLDTDAIVQELVSAYSLKKENIVKKQTKLEWTQDAWKDMNTKIYSFYSSKLSNMRLSGSYSKKTSSISNSSVAKVTASTGAVNGTQSLKVKQLATSGYLTGAAISDKDGSKLKGSSKLSDVKGLDGISDLGSIEVEADGKTTVIELSSDMTINQFVTKLKDAGVNASFDEKNQRFFISAKTSGAEGDFALNASDADSITALKSLGIYAVTDAELAKYKADAAMDVEEAVNAAYEKQKTADTDASTETKNLNTLIDTLTKERESLATKEEYLATKAELLKLGYTEDADGNVTLTTDGVEKIEARISELETNIADLAKKVSDGTGLTEEEEALKKSYENQLKAAKDALGVVGNAVLTAEDIKTTYEKTNEELAAATQSITDTDAKLVEVEADLVDIDTYVAEKNAEIAEKNAELKSNLEAYYTELKATAQSIVDNYASNSAVDGAVRIVGKDSEIELNGATFTNNTNSFDINGLTIQVTALTEGDEAVTITTDTDIDGIYNMVKDFFKSYNELIKSMDEAYNAASAKEYEPLSDDEKEAMTDDQIEKWEQKIKDALLRKDNTLGTLSSMMKTVMSSAFEIDGEKLSLASFGIKTAGYFSSGDNEKGVFHIDGDADDSTTSGNEDKLRAAIAADPDRVVDFFSKLSTELYDKLTKKMSTSSLSSAYTVYNDKQMKTQYNNYTAEIEEWEEKIEAYEERYYKQFSAMETALAQLNSQTSALSGLLGS